MLTQSPKIWLVLQVWVIKISCPTSTGLHDMNKSLLWGCGYFDMTHAVVTRCANTARTFWLWYTTELLPHVVNIKGPVDVCNFHAEVLTDSQETTYFLLEMAWNFEHSKSHSIYRYDSILSQLFELWCESRLCKPACHVVWHALLINEVSSLVIQMRLPGKSS